MGIGGYWQPPADKERNSDDNGGIRKSQYYTDNHSETCIQPETVDMAKQLEKHENLSELASNIILLGEKKICGWEGGCGRGGGRAGDCFYIRVGSFLKL